MTVSRYGLSKARGVVDSMMQEVSKPRVFAVVNARSGGCAADDVHQFLQFRFDEAGLENRVHDVVKGEDIRRTVRQAVEDGHDVVVAAGGDGTVSAVANGLIGGRVRLAIIPLGTANVLARELGVPLDLQAACDLVALPSATAEVDAMKVGENYYFTQLGIGVDAAMIRDTKVEHKKWLGIAAYVWTAALRFMGFQPLRLSISADGHRVRPRALQVLLANSGTLGSSGLRWGPEIRPDDGRIDVCILKARTLLDYLSVFWSVLRGLHREERNIKYLTASRVVAIHSDRPLPVQGDGELIGETPLEVQVVPHAVRIIVPAKPSTVDQPVPVEPALASGG
jgi:YegS/Rv2252/BmrU family lipid kinase